MAQYTMCPSGPPQFSACEGFPGVTTPVVAQVMPDEIPAWRHAELKEDHHADTNENSDNKIT
eukprot:5294337-Amphidinium_carterae.2